MIAITGYLHQYEDAIVVGWETALRVAATITASEAGRMWLRHKTADRLDYPSESPRIFHFEIFARTVMSALMQINVVAARMWNFCKI